MAFNGTGTFNRIYNWVTDKNNSVPITASRMDTEMDGFATGLSNCITKDGQTTVTANIPMNSKKFTGLTTGSARTDSISLGQVQDSQFTALGTTGGSADAYTATPSPAITAYVNTMQFTAKIHATNTTTTPYLQISGIGTPASDAVIKKWSISGAEIATEAGDLLSGKIYRFHRNPANTAWIVENPEKTFQLIPTGAIIPFAGSALPTGYLACDGSAVSRSTYSSLFAALVTADGFSAQTFTVTIASPAVVTKSTHGFLGGERVRLATTGALPTGLTTGTDYYVVYVNANTFQLSSTLGGASINTSGTQSGTHTYTQSRYGLGDGSTTFNLPNLRDQFVRGYSSTRTLGTGQLDAFQGHYHNMVANQSNGTAGTGASYTTQATDATRTDLTTAAITDGTNGTPRIASETRPVNIALNYCIKY